MNYSEIFSAYNLQVVRYFISSQVLLKIFYFNEELSDKKIGKHCPRQSGNQSYLNVSDPIWLILIWRVKT